MIDQASVFADRFRNNRQALQAAVLGQNSGVDPYTALRALQLLKESDSMQMAQQGQQPTEAPSLLQEAMQPPQMPMGMAVPGQQMSQAPQQSGGLEAMPVSDQMFSGAGGGIVAFASGGDPTIESLRRKAQDAKRLYEAAAKAGDTRASDLYLRQQRDAEAALAEAMKGPEETGSAMYGKGPTIGLPDIDIPSVEDFTRFAGRNIKQEVDPAKLAEDRARSAAQVAQIPDDTGARVIPTQPMDQTPTSPTPDMMMSPGGVGLRGLEAAAGISDGSATRSIVPPAAPPPNKQDAASTAGGIGAIAQSQAMTDALATQSAARANLGAISYNPPDAVKPQTADERFQGAKGQLDNVKEYMGEDKYSAEARKIIEERTADLTNPDRNKFDKALAWFKGAAAMQKGRGLESIANAAAEVAGSYSVIKKEDRKEKNAIRDMNLNLTKAEQAREDGQKSTAMNWQDKAQADKVAAAEAAAKREDARVRVETSVKRALFESADKGVSSLMTDETQNRSIDSTAETARQRIKSDEKTREQAAAGQKDYRNNAAYTAAVDTLRKTEADVNKAMEADTDLQDVIKRIARAERLDADGKLDKNKKAELENFRTKRARLKKKYTDQLNKATERFNIISSRIMGAAGIDQEAAARQWLKNNPNAPQADAIRKELGM
jgi:hypothetical protein